jgi:large subunit ribosomal protein L29
VKEKQTYKDQTKDELKSLYRDLSKEIFDLKCELSVNRKLEKPHLLKMKKRERARVLTALHHKERA